jgi:hypothetical protein
MEVVITEEDIMEGRDMEEAIMAVIIISTSITTSISIITITIFTVLIIVLEIQEILTIVQAFQPVRPIQKKIVREIITGLRTVREVVMPETAQPRSLLQQIIAFHPQIIRPDQQQNLPILPMTYLPIKTAMYFNAINKAM